MKGYISISYRANCGNCTQWQEFSEDTLADFKRKLRSVDWKNTKEHGWICSDCVKEIKQRKG